MIPVLIAYSTDRHDDRIISRKRHPILGIRRYGSLGAALELPPSWRYVVMPYGAPPPEVALAQDALGGHVHAGFKVRFLGRTSCGVEVRFDRPSERDVFVRRASELTGPKFAPVGVRRLRLR